MNLISGISVSIEECRIGTVASVYLDDGVSVIKIETASGNTTKAAVSKVMQQLTDRILEVVK